MINTNPHNECLLADDRIVDSAITEAAKAVLLQIVTECGTTIATLRENAERLLDYSLDRKTRRRLAGPWDTLQYRLATVYATHPVLIAWQTAYDAAPLKNPKPSQECFGGGVDLERQRLDERDAYQHYLNSRDE